MAEYSYDFGGYDFAPESDYYSQDENYYDASQAQQAPDFPQWNPADDWMQLPDMQQAQVQGIEEYPGLSAGTTMPPSSLDGGGRGFMPGRNQEDDWLAQLKKAGIGMGVGAGVQALGGIANNLFSQQPKQAKMPQMPASASGQYKPEDLAPLPGTKASPLISQRPTNVKLSQGLEERKPKYGGFSMY